MSCKLEYSQNFGYYHIKINLVKLLAKFCDNGEYRIIVATKITIDN
jgi:hypothetical protein